MDSIFYEEYTIDIIYLSIYEYTLYDLVLCMYIVEHLHMSRVRSCVKMCIILRTMVSFDYQK